VARDSSGIASSAISTGFATWKWTSMWNSREVARGFVAEHVRVEYSVVSICIATGQRVHALLQLII